MRKCLQGWIDGSLGFCAKLQFSYIQEMSDLLEECNNYKPTEIHRTIRRLNYIKLWKGSEYRTFLLYLGPVILKKFVDQDIYQHFLILMCAVRIVSSFKYKKYMNVAEILFKDYIRCYINLYGRGSITSNVHNLCHIVNDVKKFGPLPIISTYPFENILGHMKHMLRSGNLPLQQIAKRTLEFSKIGHLSTNSVVNISPEQEIKGILHEIPGCEKVFLKINYKNQFVISNNVKNKWFLTTSGEIVQMLNAILLKGKLYIYGQALRKQYDFFQLPIKSSYIDIYESDGQFCAPKLFSAENEIEFKLFCHKTNKSLVFFPLIHMYE